MKPEHYYLCIDLKSFYASVECVERGLDPLTTHLVVADPQRTEKTVCLAVSPSMRAQGVKNRCRVFQIPKNISYIMAPPRMALYIKYSAEIYGIYLKYIAKEDIHVYSIDEAFLDVTHYLHLYKMTVRELAKKIMDDILKTTGITATCGIGTNLYLAKVALDIKAKHVQDHIGYLDEASYQKNLWNHKPLTDFWRIGGGIAKSLRKYGITTMGQIAETDEDFLYELFGTDAELLIDHAYGREPVTMADIKNYKQKANSVSSGQVLRRDYDYEEGLLIVKEMADSLVMELLEKELVTDSISLLIGYSRVQQKEEDRGTIRMTVRTNSIREIMPYVCALYEKTAKKEYSVRRIHLTFNRVLEKSYEQYDLFTDREALEKDKKLQSAALQVKQRFGKNALVRGMDLQEAATAMERNRQIGGHKSGE